MLKFFNAFQITTLFAAFPFGISWLAHQEFPYRSAAVGVAAVVYLISFYFMTIAVFIGLDKTNG